MSDNQTLSYCELRAKEVINIIDGRKLGRIIDVIFCVDKVSRIKGIVVPYARRVLFSRSQDVFVPWNCIRKIGEDVILVDLIMDGSTYNDNRRRGFDRYEYDENVKVLSEESIEETEDSKKNAYEDFYGKKPSFGLNCQGKKVHKVEHKKPPLEPNCDRKCEKCMLFDCIYRWKDA